MKKIRILIVDDQPIVCEGLKTILQLEDDFEVTGICHNGREALEICGLAKPDIVLMDARMPVINGIAATKEISRLFPDTKVLILTTFNEERLIFEGIQSGAKGFLLKDMPPDELCKCIRAVHSGGACLHPDVTLKVMERIAMQGAGASFNDLPENSLAQLTNREKEVLRFIGRGLSNAEIATALFITEGTVKNHVSSLLAKLGARDRTQLAILAQKF
ncbi:response regulator transcription factor [Pelotomaculum propionicicum]|uniref:Stage 0 sporulation protein A homolog n=1 Tax=Pelotomaculum propionicicum TaxID=258475 RepID=A0A4Y7RM81_9FIRM|nr:response regulator transcription factor [Pelotomaculum propionicicum]NLI12937.1 response regulator transcription factor [Peptococcaceae bacterium]TEB09839.1 Transcriptional regulatory protein DegU [Pelotomaculum propionicicum]